MTEQELQYEFERITNAVYAGKMQPEDMDKWLFDFTQDSLWKGVVNGFGKDFAEVQHNAVDFEMLNSLQQNTFHFSGAKTYHQLLQLNAAIVDESGTHRNFSDFKEEAAKILDNFNGNYLHTEYNYAVASSQMASRWVRIQETKDTLPMLRYQTVGDARVRAAHQALNGITKAADDLFWDTYYPPNDFNCRCEAIQQNGTKETPEDKIPAVEIPKMFRTNTAKLGLVYPPEHPYYNIGSGDFDKVKAFVEKQTKDIRDKHIKEFIEIRKREYHAYDAKLYPIQKRFFDGDTGGFVVTHKDSSKSAYTRNFEMGKLLASHKREAVELLDESTSAKGADAKRNKTEWEFKQIKHATNLKNAIAKQIERAIGQSDKVLVHVDQTHNWSKIGSGVYNGLVNKDKKGSIKTVEVILSNGKSRVFDGNKIRNPKKNS